MTPRGICATLCLALGAVAIEGAPPATLSHSELLQDTRTLMQTLENVHPDPYLRAGGKIELHRHFQRTLLALPAAGLKREDFAALLSPLLASVGDGHTALRSSAGLDPFSPGGIPLYFETAPDCLYVVAVLEEDQRELLGARLRAIEGVAIDDLLERAQRRRAADNIHHLRRTLGGQGVLWYGSRLQQILPEWTQHQRIEVELALPDGSVTTPELAIPEKVDYSQLILPPSSDPALLFELVRRTQAASFFFHFLDSEHQRCLLVIKDLMSYREAFEVWESYQIAARREQARALYQRRHDRSAPQDYTEVLAGLPSATEVFSQLRDEMRNAGTRTLIVDLSQNDGGSSVMSSILLWSLYGREAVLSSRQNGTEIVKYSEEYFEQFPVPSLGEINRDRSWPLAATDYDLSGDRSGGLTSGASDPAKELARLIARMPSFAAAWNDGASPPPYTPERVIVLCDGGTYSAAFTLLHHLKRAGATVVGMPPAQAGNCFGDVMSFTLPNSELAYTVSRKYFELFPGDAEQGRVLLPDRLMSYGDLARYDFDPLALLRFALDGPSDS